MSKLVSLPDWAEPLFQPKRYKCLYGGRGSGKSYTIAASLLLIGASRPCRILCCREFQNSLSDSSLQLLADQIEWLGLQDFYEVQREGIYGRNGTAFIFKGLRHNPQSIKSMAGITHAWLEEADTVSEHSWSILIPTIREPGSEIWCSYNPHKEEDPTHQRMVVSPPPDSYIRKVNFRDNPFFPEELRKEMEYLRSVDTDAYLHVWEGECRQNSDSQILNGKWTIEEFEEPNEEWGNKYRHDVPTGPYYGADWGFAKDPNTLVRCWIFRRTLYIEYEAYGVGIEISDTPEFFERVPDSKRHTIRADSARPETISHVRRHGYQIVPCEKWPGSVEDGIAFLRSFERIVIHPRCKHVIQEARLWSYKVDRLTGDVLPKVKDGNDHCWDAIRYALGPMIQASRGGGVKISSWL